jgi:hypothetical protein
LGDRIVDMSHGDTPVSDSASIVHYVWNERLDACPMFRRYPEFDRAPSSVKL